MRWRMLVCFVACIVDWLSAKDARANGRYPHSQKVYDVSGRPNQMYLRTTFGLLTSVDFGASWYHVCERVVFGMRVNYDLDPLFEVAADGSVLSGSWHGLRVSRDGACSWQTETALPVDPVFFQGAARNDSGAVVDLARSVGGQLYALVTRNGTTGDPDHHAVYVSLDDARSWRALGNVIPATDADRMLTLELAPDDENRIYLTGQTAQGGALFMSTTDGGHTWDRRDMGAAIAAEVYLLAPSPRMPRALFARGRNRSGSGGTRDELYYSQDGGESWTTLQSKQAGLLGFAISPDASTVLSAYGDTGYLQDAVNPSDTGIYRASTGSFAFDKIFDGNITCLDWLATGLYACSGRVGGAFHLGVAPDAEFELGENPFRSLLTLPEIAGPLPWTGAAAAGFDCTNDWRIVDPSTGQVVGGLCQKLGACRDGSPNGRGPPACGTDADGSGGSGGRGSSDGAAGAGSAADAANEGGGGTGPNGSGAPPNRSACDCAIGRSQIAHGRGDDGAVRVDRASVGCADAKGFALGLLSFLLLRHRRAFSLRASSRRIELRRGAMAGVLAACAALLACGADGGDAMGTAPFSRERLLDPETCGQCHAQHYEEWSASMHAYASDDPVFLAMNQRGQEETRGALGNFCIDCHAPMAARERKVTNGSSAALVATERKYRGVTCYFCHNAESVEGTHNNPIRLSDEGSLAARTMRGSFADPEPNAAHRSSYSPLMDRYDVGSANLCGSCHDIELPSPPAPPPLGGTPLHLERTFEEWQDSSFLLREDATYPGLSCNGCHMKPSAFRAEGPVAGPGLRLKSRRINEHFFPGVDVALGTFPNSGDAADDDALTARHRAAVEAFLVPSVRIEKVCVKPALDRSGTLVYVSLDNVGAGHGWPSGATHDRRAWVEIKVYREGSTVPVYASGVVAQGEDVTKLDDRDLWLIRDDGRDGKGDPARMFWDIAELRRGTIGAPVTRDPADPRFLANHSARYFPKQEGAAIAGIDYRDARVTVRLYLQAVGRDVLDDLAASGHLDPSLRSQMPVWLVRADIHIDPDYSFEFSSSTWNSPYFDRAPTDELGKEGRCIGSRKN